MSQLATLQFIQPHDLNAYAWGHQFIPDYHTGSKINTHRDMLPSQDAPVQQKRRGRPRKEVDHSKQKAEEPTPKFQIVMQNQPGQASDQKSLRLIRSHAMLAVRKQQREKRKAALNEKLPPLRSRDENSLPTVTQAETQTIVRRPSSIPSPQSPLLGWAGTSQEIRAMTYFREKAVFALSGWRDAKLWPQIVQRSQTVPELRHALIGLAVMHETLCSNDHIVTERLSLCDESMFAIQSYHKSLASLRTSISSASYATVLMSSILISAFQAFDNDPACFLTWKSGLALYDQFSGDSLDWSAPAGTSEDDRYFVNTEVAPMFQMYRDRCCNFYDQQYGLRFAISTGKFPATMKPHVPPFFSTLWQARDTLADILNWACGCIRVPIASPALEPPVALELTTLLHLWSIALDATTSRLVRLPIVGELDEDDFQRTKARLAAARLLGEILIGTVGSDRESDMDPYDSHFEKIVRLYQQTEPRERALRQHFSFGIQSGVLETMIFVALRCRDPNLRRQAVDVLRYGARFEGPFNGVQNCTILDAVIEFEEAGLRSVACSRDVPEQNRLRFQSIEIFPTVEKIRFRYTRAPYVDLGAKVEEKIVDMPPRCGLKIRRYVIEPVDLDNSLVPAAFMSRGSSSFPLMNSSQYFVMQTKGFAFPVPRV